MAHHEGNNVTGVVLFVIGWVTKWIHEIESLNTMLDLGLKITSYISFGLFIIINWDKIKRFFKKTS
jgi:hypothetical protein